MEKERKYKRKGQDKTLFLSRKAEIEELFENGYSVIRALEFLEEKYKFGMQYWQFRKLAAEIIGKNKKSINIPSEVIISKAPVQQQEQQPEELKKTGGPKFIKPPEEHIFGSTKNK